MRDYVSKADEIIAARGVSPDPERLHRLFDLQWQYTMEGYPEFATYVGWPGQNHRWTDISLEAIERRNREMEVPARVLATIDRSALGADDQLHHDLFRRGVEESLEGRRFKAEYMPINQMQGVQQNVAQTIAMMRAATSSDYDDVVARLRGVPRLIDQTIALLEKGLEVRITPPRVTLREVPQQILNQVVEDPQASPLLRPFSRFPEAVPEPDRERLRRAAAEAYQAEVAPAYRRLHGYFAETYLPRTREAIALAALPARAAW